jgi:hypothetical protein
MPVERRNDTVWSLEDKIKIVLMGQTLQTFGVLHLVELGLGLDL